MQLTNFFTLVALLSFHMFSVFAAPVANPEPVGASSELEKRVGTDAGTGTQADPYIFNIDCAGVEEVCEAQCAAILCFKSPALMQYGGEGSSTEQRKLSGAAAKPFTSGALLVGSTPKAPKKIDLSALNQPTWRSPEDTTNASSKQGGKGTLIAPVNAGHNTREGSRYSGQLSHYKTQTDEWFKKKYFNAGKYCTALMDGNAADTVCKKDANADDPIHFMFRRTSQKSGNSILWQQLKYGTDTYAVNFPGF
ncbi:hypothetical protein MFRU_003g03730 [Monilinia fructicola]|nr:hypothetical protein MFRU_003g03730 [Monilinia fructicola]